VCTQCDYLPLDRIERRVAKNSSHEVVEAPRKTRAARRPFWRSLWFRVAAIVVVAGLAAFSVAAVYIARHAEPILRRSVVANLSKRFHSPVELDHLDISVARVLQVRGSGLRILYVAGPTQPSQQPNAPMLSVRSFTFRVSLRELLHLHADITTVHVDGMDLHIPPHRNGLGLLDDSGEAKSSTQPRIVLFVDHILCHNARIFIETTPKPGGPPKDPLEFDITNLDLTNVGQGQPMLYQADIINPRPRGDVRATGHFGPWVGADPRSTPLDGDYTFQNADLNTIKGLGGILSSVGHFSGQLGNITIDGTTDTPKFSLDVSNHPMPLTTSFHAFVDGTSGDTTLAPVQATLGRSQFTAAGAIMRVKGKGHDIALTVAMPHGRIEDLLELGVKTQPPVMSGTVTMHARVHIPPGDARVAAKLELAGNLDITGVEFSNAKLQDRIDGLSMRAQGKPKDVKAADSDGRAEVASEMAVTFTLGHELMTVSSLNYEVPGAKVALDGVYSLDGNIFEFKGHVRTDATASQMLTGWKSVLVKPFDDLLKKNGAGVELPIELSGAKGDIKFGLAMHDANETPADMAADLKAKRQVKKDSDK